LVNNTQNAIGRQDKYNDWDDGKYGNYWDDYEEHYPDAKQLLLKGIWDTPYEIPGGSNIDGYPLLDLWEPTISDIALIE